MMRSMSDLLQQGVFFNRRIMFQRDTSRDVLHAQHAAINDAIQQRQPNKARTAVETHLDFIKQCLLDDIKSQQNAKIARQKLDQQATRDPTDQQ